MDIKETIKKDIEYIFSKMEKLRIEYPWSKLSSQENDKEEPDFRPYRSMGYCLIDTFNNYKLINNNLIKADDEFISKFIKKLTYEIRKLHETMEQYKEGYRQFKCLNDVFIKLTRLLQSIGEQIASSLIELYKNIYEQESQREKLYKDGYSLKIEIIKEKQFTNEQISKVKKLLEEIFSKDNEINFIDIDTSKSGKDENILIDKDELEKYNRIIADKLKALENL